MVTLKEILKQPLFSGLKPLTNNDSLNKAVSTIDITENYDVANFTSKNAFILTTASNFKDDQTKLIPFIKSLIRIDVAGLGIKVSRFLEELDNNVLEFANKNNFAIIEIPSSMTLGVLTHNLFDFILEKQSRPMVHALKIQKHFSDLFMKNASTQTIIDELSSFLNTPICLLDTFYYKIAESKSNFSDESFSQKEVAQIKKRIQNGINYEGETIELHNPKTISAVFIHTIKTNFLHNYYLLIKNPNELSYPMDIFTIDQAHMILSYTFYKNFQIEKSMVAIQNNFFKNLVFGEFAQHIENEDFFEFSINYGLINSSEYQVINCQVRSDCTFDINNLGFMGYQWILTFLLPEFKYSLVFYDEEKCMTTILMQQNSPDLKEKLNHCSKEFEKIIGEKINFGIGRIVSNPNKIRNSYFEGLRALENSSDSNINEFTPEGIFSLFSNKNEEAVKYFIKKELKNLPFSNNEFHQELLSTLKVYLDNQSEVAKTAEQLYLHRNTVTYRIKKCEELLNIDLSDPQTTLNLRVALELYDFYR